MAEPIAIEGVAALDHNAHLVLSSSVLPIVMYLRRQYKTGERRNLNDPIGVLSGIVTNCGGKFCHLIAAESAIYPRSQGLYQYKVFFPNGESIELDTRTVKRHDNLAAFFVRIPTDVTMHGTMQVVQFSPYPASRNLNVRMFGYAASQFPPAHVQSELSDGFVTHPEPNPGCGFFRHDCTPSYLSRRGSPVFDNHGRLVGISYKDEGVTRALNMEGIRHELSRIYDLGEMTIEQIVSSLEDIGAARFRKKQRGGASKE